MVQSSVSDEHIRAFIAIELPAWLKGALGKEMASLRSSLGETPLRWVRPEAVHLTLRFLGDTSPTMLDAITDALRPLCSRHAPFEIEVGGLGRFPRGPRPRVLWIGVRQRGGGLAALQAELEQRISALGLRGEPRPFHPHLTLARVRRDVSAPGLRRLAEQLDQAQAGELGRLKVEQVALMRSILGPQGASYSRLRHFDLTGAA